MSSPSPTSSLSTAQTQSTHPIPPADRSTTAAAAAPTTTTTVTSTTTTNPPTVPAAPPPNPHLTDQARTAFTAHLSSLASSHLHPLQVRASDIATNARAIDKQDAALTKATPGLEKEAGKLMKEAERAQGRLKELGDIQNWAEVLERDLCVVETALALGEGEDLGDGWETEVEWEGEEPEGEEDGEEEGQASGKKKVGRAENGDKPGEEEPADMMANKRLGKAVEAEVT